MKKQTFAFFCALMMTLPVLTGCGKDSDSPDVIRVGVSIPSADHGWTGGVVWWANKAVKDIQTTQPGKFNFRVITADGPSSQVAHVENLLVWGMHYLVILPHESAPLTPIVREVQSKGVKVIVVDRGLTDSSFGYVNLAGDNAAMGRISGEWIAKEMKASGLSTYVAMGGLPVTIDTERMTAFFKEMNKEPSLVNLLGPDKYEFADWSSQKGLTLMETFLQKYNKIDAVFCQDDDVLLGVMQAIKESARKDVKIVFGGGGSKVVYKMIMDGDPLVRATATYHPSMIADGIRYAVDIANGVRDSEFHNLKSPTTVVIPSVLVDKSNVAEYYESESIY